MPEILDALPAQDHRALRVRRDLQSLDFFLGNSRWILRCLRHLNQKDHGKESLSDIAELGAGEGLLCKKIAARFPEADVTGYDLKPSPKDLSGKLFWVEGDLIKTLKPHSVVVGAMVLHHFSDDLLAELGGLLKKCNHLVFVEPLRTRTTLALSCVAWPFVGAVTRHDMPASIRAGFLPGNLPRLLHLKEWRIRETTDHRGALHFEAWRD